MNEVPEFDERRGPSGDPAAAVPVPGAASAAPGADPSSSSPAPGSVPGAGNDERNGENHRSAPGGTPDTASDATPGAGAPRPGTSGSGDDATPGGTPGTASDATPGAAPDPAAGPGTDREIGELVGRLAADDDELDRETRGRLLARLARLLSASARAAGATGVARGRWLADLFAAIVPHVPIRDRATLTAHHHGLTGEALADNLVKVAANATTAVGAAGGALAAVEFAAPPLLLSAPAQLAAETLVVAAIEVKMIAELHEVYDVRVQGSGAVRAAAFATAWARQRGVNPLEGSLTGALGAASKAALRKRMLRTLGRSMSTMGPFLTGAAAGAALNRTATRKLAASVRDDLRDLGGPAPELPGDHPGLTP
ncbi:hypothetical protein [Actinomadura gamaensis]|uniref:EcsC family protein n=1 Tax=Actinomadura gamaensis TaxID=1763541 RepID=A0ABV9UB41_9ACTN